MSKSSERIILIFSDLVTINVAWVFYYYIRVESGWIIYANPPGFLEPLIVIYLYWLLIFSFAGLYQHWFARSRFDEFTLVFKSVTFGCFFLFFAIFIDDYLKNAPVISRFLIVIYWILMITCVSIGRILIRSIQKNFLRKGIGLRNTLIVGTGRKAKELIQMITDSPELGHRVIGSVSENGYGNHNSLGSIEQLSGIIKEHEVDEIIVALEPKDKEMLFDVLKYCTDEKVSTKILPDMYEIVSGMAKTRQIYGVPLIEVASVIMPPSGMITKRFIDIIISLILLLITSPLLLLSMLMVRVDSKGPVFYKQLRVGKKGKEFMIYKLRTMTESAESSGPQWSHGNDPRITRVGKILRKTRLDELPQLINVIKNDMSIVGPRPERPFFVDKLSKEIPYYHKRMIVKPGITGWAQIKHKYDASIEDVKSKLQYDFYYIENMSLKLDFIIMVNTVFVMIKMKGV